ncbi:MAG: large conductance mechanosensitive channel protein MscL [Ruminococcaceae bacterium]|nr:large conductance mechanosensitive channel protein MscL [Oscillospiraceae bacterium]
MPREKIKRERKKFWGEFKAFISKGSVVDLAVAIVIGTAFNKIVSQLVDSFITPLIGIVLGGFSLDDRKWVYKEAVLDADGTTVMEAEIAFTYGAFLQAVIDFLIIAFTVFVVVKLYTRVKKHIEEEAKRLNEALNPEEVEARKRAEEEARQKEELAKKLEAERLAEIESLKQEKEEAQRDYFLKQQELLTQIRDALNK